jgi:hypothetical protein
MLSQNMVRDISGELMRQAGRVDRVKEQIVLIARTQTSVAVALV